MSIRQNYHSGNRVEFAIEASEGNILIGVGSHRRPIIDLEKFAAGMR